MSKSFLVLFFKKEHFRPFAALSQIGAVTLALLLFSHGIATTPLNYDEGATLYFAHLPLRDLWGAPARLETNPPLYYTLLHAWVALAGDSQASLRLPSVLAAALCVPLATSLAARLAPNPAAASRAAKAAAFLVASSPSHLVEAQDARTYALLALCILMALQAALTLCAEMAGAPRARLAWVRYVVACLAALYAHNTAVLIVSALGAGLLFAAWRDTNRRGSFLRAWLLANAILAAAYLVWLPTVWRQTTVTLAHFWLRVPGLADLRYSLMNVFGQPHAPALPRLADAAFLAAGFAGLWLCRRHKTHIAFAGLLLLCVPVASWLISQWRPILNGKTLEWMVPIWLTLVAIGCTHRPRLALPATAALVAVQLAGCAHFLAARPQEGFDRVAAELRARARPGDTLYTDPASNLILLRYYGFDPAGLAVYSSAGADPWYRAPGFTVLQPADLTHVPRLWILTRTGATVHAALLQKLGNVPIEIFGSGNMRNLRLSWIP